MQLSSRPALFKPLHTYTKPHKRSALRGVFSFRIIRAIVAPERNIMIRLCTLIIVARPHDRHGFQIALATKTKRLCKGKLSFPGGHVETDEPIYKGALRELKEELGVVPKLPHHLWYLGELCFFCGKQARKPRTLVHVFWLNVDKETVLRGSDELACPRWFSVQRIPWHRMMPADPLWINTAYGTILSGLRFRTSIWYNKKKTRVVKHTCDLLHS